MPAAFARFIARASEAARQGTDRFSLERATNPCAWSSPRARCRLLRWKVSIAGADVALSHSFAPVVLMDEFYASKICHCCQAALTRLDVQYSTQRSICGAIELKYANMTSAKGKS